MDTNPDTFINYFKVYKKLDREATREENLKALKKIQQLLSNKNNPKDQLQVSKAITIFGNVDLYQDFIERLDYEEEVGNLRQQTIFESQQKELDNAKRKLKFSNIKKRRELTKVVYIGLPILVLVSAILIWYHQIYGLFNAAPIGQADYAVTKANRTVNIDIFSNDYDENDDKLFLKILSDPSNGIVTFNGKESIIYKPDYRFLGTDQFYYVLSDGKRESGQIFVNVEVKSNAPPSLREDLIKIKENQTQMIYALENDFDSDDTNLTIIHVSDPSNGSVILNENSNITYTPNNNFYGTDSFEYQVSDGSDTLSSYITVNVEENFPPQARDDRSSVRTGKTATIKVLVNDSDENQDPLEISSISKPNHGSAQINSLKNAITYTSSPGYSGSDFFNYTISDGLAKSTGRVTINVSPNRSPSARNDKFRIDPGTNSIRLDVLNNDTDPEGDEIRITDVIRNDNSRGNLSYSESYVSYTPPHAFYGATIEFQYTIKDVDNASSSAKAEVNIAYNGLTCSGSDFQLTIYRDGKLSGRLNNGTRLTGKGSVANNVFYIDAKAENIVDEIYTGLTGFDPGLGSLSLSIKNRTIYVKKTDIFFGNTYDEEVGTCQNR